MIHSFNEELKFSLNTDLEHALNESYKKIFPVENIETITDINLQKLGVDKIITLTNGRRLSLDEKIRKTDYQDILLEKYSNSELKVAGWINDHKITDFISYVIISSRIYYLISYPLLRSTWNRKKDDWEKMFGTKTAQNQGYSTVSIPVPFKELFSEINSPIVY